MRGQRRRFQFSEIINGDTITSQWARMVTVYSRGVDWRYIRQRRMDEGERRYCSGEDNLSKAVLGGLDHSKSTNVTLKPLLIFKGIPADIFIVHVLLLYECGHGFCHRAMSIRSPNLCYQRLRYCSRDFCSIICPINKIFFVLTSNFEISILRNYLTIKGHSWLTQQKNKIFWEIFWND